MCLKARYYMLMRSRYATSLYLSGAEQKEVPMPIATAILLAIDDLRFRASETTPHWLASDS